MIPPTVHQFKMVFVGDSGVGKSSLLIRFVDDKFDDTLLSTIGVDFHFRSMNIDNQKVKVQVWDTAGQQAFRSIVSAYYHSADAIVIIYDITQQKSYESVKQYWLKQALEHNTNDAMVFLMGNKIDETQHKRQVQSYSLEALLDGNTKVNKFYEVSAKMGTNVTKAFDQIIRMLIKNKNKKQGGNITVGNTQKKKIDLEKNKGKVGGAAGSNSQCCLK